MNNDATRLKKVFDQSGLTPPLTEAEAIVLTNAIREESGLGKDEELHVKFLPKKKRYYACDVPANEKG